MIILYHIKRALNYRRRHLNSSLRQDLTYIIYFFVLSLSIQLFAYFRAANELTFTPQQPGDSVIDMTKEFEFFLSIFSSSNLIILIALLIFGGFNLYVSLQRARIIANKEFDLKFLNGSSSFSLAVELFLRELISLPFVYLMAFNLTFFLVPDLVSFFNWALPFVEKGQLTISTVGASLKSFPFLIAVLASFLPIIWLHLKQQLRPKTM